ncbi:MAG: hypothetical protein EA377_01060 [Phycisphaerales bacterium]|nr:MAG: hypothetical protein EA377_01060 [Phycisphaerales bacterium]
MNTRRRAHPDQPSPAGPMKRVAPTQKFVNLLLPAPARWRALPARSNPEIRCKERPKDPDVNSNSPGR